LKPRDNIKAGESSVLQSLTFAIVNGTEEGDNTESEAIGRKVDEMMK
jgi:hypothetical protein